MAKTYWYINAKTRTVDSYTEDGEWTDFPKGEFIVYGDYLVTGFDTKTEAEEALKKYHACPYCESARPTKEDGVSCFYCNEIIKNLTPTD